MLKSKKNKMLFLVVIGITLLMAKPVYAIKCDALFTRDAYDFINDIIDWVRILTPILLIVLCSVDLIQAVLASDDKQMKTATSRSIKRAIAAIAVFFVPLLVRVLIDITGIEGSIVDDPKCGLDEVGE